MKYLRSEYEGGITLFYWGKFDATEKAYASYVKKEVTPFDILIIQTITFIIVLILKERI